jgi:peptidyl-prolyl cis-trans isomerase D
MSVSNCSRPLRIVPGQLPAHDGQRFSKKPMFDFVHKNKRLVQFVLALLVLPFAFVGVDSYVRNIGSDKDVATVGGQGVSPQEFENALRAQQDQMRRVLGKSFDPAMFDNPEVRQQVLDGVVNQRLLQVVGQDLKLTAPDAQLRKTILEVPDFQDGGKFSEARYDELLRANGFTRLSYESRLRGDLAQQPLQDVLTRTNFSSAAQAALYQKLTEQGRGNPGGDAGARRLHRAGQG